MKISASRRLTGEELSAIAIPNLTVVEVSYDLYEPAANGGVDYALRGLFARLPREAYSTVATVTKWGLQDVADCAKMVLDERDTKARHQRIVNLMPPADLSTVLAKDSRARYYRDLGGFVKFVRELDDSNATLYLHA